MTITLNHTIVPARDKEAAARFFARIFGLRFDDSEFYSHHYAFHVGDAEFDAILARIREAGVDYGSAPWRLADGTLNDRNGGRGVYFRDPDGHVLELMTAPQ
jgi:catechol 2,3-dioxygenase-like lactoylglutathione lyase family enzyme